MSEKIYHINKNNILVKIMKYIWNLDHRDFSHMCPFFWLSIFNLIVIIPYFTLCKILLGIKIIFVYVCNFLDAYFEEMDRKILEKKIIKYYEISSKTPKDIDLNYKEIDNLRSKAYKYTIGNISENKVDNMFSSIFRAYQEKQKIKEKQKRIIEIEKEKEKQAKEREIRINKFKSIAKNLSESEISLLIETNNYESYIRKYESDKKEIERQRLIANKIKINKIIKIIKPIFTYLAYTIGTIIVLICLYYLFTWSCSLIVWIKNTDFTFTFSSVFIKIIKDIGWIILYAILVFIFGFILYKLISKINFKFFDKVGNFFLFLIKIIIYPFKKIYSLGSLITTMIKNECPPIKWED